MYLNTWPIKTLPTGPIFDENGPLGNRFPNSEKMYKTFLEGNEIGKVIEEQVWTKYLYLQKLNVTWRETYARGAYILHSIVAEWNALNL